MLTIALVSHCPEDVRAKIRALVGEVELLDFSADRAGLVERGAKVEIVYGNVRDFELPALPNLKWVQCSWSGIENVLYPAMVASDVMVSNVRGTGAVPIAENIVGGLLYFARAFDQRIAAEKDRAWKIEAEVHLMRGARALLLGTGEIGKALIPILNGFGMRIRGVNSDGRAVAGCDETFTLQGIHEHLGDVDFVIALLPLTPATGKLLDDRFFAALKPGAIIANGARGRLLDEDALLEHLESGHLRGAMLDVTDPEPPLTTNPLWDHPRCLLTGHQAGRGVPPDTLPTDTFLFNLEKYVAGDLAGMKWVVDKGKGY